LTLGGYRRIFLADDTGYPARLRKGQSHAPSNPRCHQSGERNEGEIRSRSAEAVNQRNPQQNRLRFHGTKLTGMKVSKAYANQVFLNCPFDKEYQGIFEAIIFSVLHCGFVIRCARERDDSAETRISKIVDIIRGSQFGIHDISRVELDETNGLPRFNMPLELGLFLGARAFSNEAKHRKKKCLILDSEPYRYQKFISDIAGQDIRSHNGCALTALKVTRDWLANVVNRKLPGSLETERLYSEFHRDLPLILAELSLPHNEVQFVEYVKVAMEWLRDRQIASSNPA